MEGIKDENGTVSETTNSTHRKESFAEIGVYFQSLNKKLVYEEPKYTASLILLGLDLALIIYITNNTLLFENLILTFFYYS